jgi:hypothetical protein
MANNNSVFRGESETIRRGTRGNVTVRFRPSTPASGVSATEGAADSVTGVAFCVDSL